MESDKEPQRNVEELGDVTQAKVFKAPKPGREHKPLPTWFKKTMAVLGLLIIAGASFFGGWKLTEDKKAGGDNSAKSYQAAEWSGTRTNASVPRTEVSAVLYKGKVFVVGGFDKDGNPQNAVEVFDPEEDEWAVGSALPEAVHHTTAVVFEGKVYVVGGLTGTDQKATSKVFAFNGEKWAEGPALPEPIGAHGAAVLDNRLYVVGGVTANGESTTKMYSLGVGETEWREEEPMLTARNHLAVVAADGKLYAIGGRNSSSMTLQTVEVYDPSTKVWQPTVDMPTGRSGIAAAVLANKIYVFGGESKDKTFAEAEEFDTKTRTWETLHAMRAPRHGLGSVVFNNAIYLFLGGPNPGLSVSDDVQILNFTEK